MGNDIDDLAKMQQEWKEGTAICPRVSKAGLVDGRDPMQSPTGIFVTTQEEANAAVNHYADLGYIQTKVYSSLNPALLPGTIQVSHQRGMRVSASQIMKAAARSRLQESEAFPGVTTASSRKVCADGLNGRSWRLGVAPQKDQPPAYFQLT